MATGASCILESPDLSVLVQADANLWRFWLLSITNNNVNDPIYYTSPIVVIRSTVQETGTQPTENKQNFLLRNIWEIFPGKQTRRTVVSCYIKVQFKYYSFISQAIKTQLDIVN